MKISKIEVENFRLLGKIEISLDEEVTLIVGRNNSGKTSLTEIFYKFLSSNNSQFTFEDFSVSTYEQFKEAAVLYDEYMRVKNDSESEEEIFAKEQNYKNKIPYIAVQIYMEYDESDNLSSLSKFIMDLDVDRKDVLISCEYKVDNVEKLFKTFVENSSTYGDNIIKFLKNNYKSFYKQNIYAVDEQKRSSKIKVDKKDVDAVFLARFISAQNQLDDQSVDHNNGLSKGFEEYFKSSCKESSGLVDDIKKVLLKAAEDLDGNYESLFDGIVTDLKNFGLNSGVDIQTLKIKSQFEPETILKNNALLFYEHGDNLLPEAHNGLGYSKLIFIVLSFIRFYEEMSKKEPKPNFQFLFLEEPEAHLHPQMQQVFIKNIKKFIKDKQDWNVQIIITTHSSHIIAESGFSCIRYFDISENKLTVKNLSNFIDNEDVDTINFLQQYMTLNRCDVFFADKIIMIEGTVERLLLPEMIKREAKELQSQFVSIIEVGGAYAQKFKKLLEFINVKTLIITDIDSVDTSKKRKACEVSSGENIVTCNKMLIDWLPKKEKISDLLSQKEKDKIDKKVCVSYQVPEEGMKVCGRSFEEAFILKNAGIIFDKRSNLLSLGTILNEYLNKGDVEKNSYNIADAISKKTDFAFDVMLINDWETPRYIKNGLVWLK